MSVRLCWQKLEREVVLPAVFTEIDKRLQVESQHGYYTQHLKKVSQNCFHHNSNKRRSKFIKIGKHIHLSKLIKVMELGLSRISVWTHLIIFDHYSGKLTVANNWRWPESIKVNSVMLDARVTIVTFASTMCVEYWRRHIVGMIVQCKRGKITWVLTAVLGTTKITHKHMPPINSHNDNVAS